MGREERDEEWAFVWCTGSHGAFYFCLTLFDLAKGDELLQ